MNGLDDENQIDERDHYTDDGDYEIDIDSMNMFKSLYYEMMAYFSDLQMHLGEHLMAIDWDMKCKSIAEPVGNCLTALFYIIRLLQDTLLSNYKDVYVSTEAFDLSKSTTLQEFPFLIRFVEVSKTKNLQNAKYIKKKTFMFYFDKLLLFLMILILSTNAYISWTFIWRNFKTYSLLYVVDRPNSKNVTKCSRTDLDQSYMENVSYGSYWTMLSYYIRNFRKKDDLEDEITTVKQKTPNVNEKDYYYQLKKWSPSKFLTSLFCSFSPTCLVFLILSDVSFTTSIAVILHQFIFKYVVFEGYESRINDESIIHSAMISEINQKFVEPRLSKKVQDAKIDATPEGKVYRTEFFPSLTNCKSNLFNRHDLKGRSITESYNDRIKEFEIVTNTNNETHNVIKVVKK
ncbi:hypothetical protein Kpol_1032p72 [Vanderwaltozyma polyspora DSM 70294]|uniref:Nuclear rim protein 1 n=1 Tax=Vanderwaltozyma polyspora (strain ATCC 22028 / DSM 70294 / BCRC 21397 / CBS 2163 / NBRC 10782 / NRRL Y-8283 / UCD 57-17) TaxID=436907 RepID=NUR1_VANPO|nr:uncharacterized protein Kpol_1032p72 [Vanderwaltozyma polyspora DSM 70294]A7TH24.1 RecName: Full=Nuclear rim protein 1 [Vanderwaltozyma polyspora DSM 70294]EDO18476.1 hypothetical protein Kpol_1032p72 [Vanderwaltozyma polyspora DSM 70294]